MPASANPRPDHARRQPSAGLGAESGDRRRRHRGRERRRPHGAAGATDQSRGGGRRIHRPGRQLGSALDEVDSPALVLIFIGANDVTIRRTERPRCATSDHGPPGTSPWGRVVVATCPDLGTVEPVPQPLRLLIRRWSRDLAAAQTVAVVEAGGRTVSLGDIPDRSSRLRRTSSSAGPFPSVAGGLCPAAAAVLPTVCHALGLWVRTRPTGRRRSVAARASGRWPWLPGRPCSKRAPRSAQPRWAGPAGGPRGRWAVLRHRRQSPVDTSLPAESLPARRGRRPSPGGDPGRGAEEVTFAPPSGTGQPGRIASSSTSTFQRRSTNPQRRPSCSPGGPHRRRGHASEISSTSSTEVRKWRVRTTSETEPPSSASAPRAISQQRRAWAPASASHDHRARSAPCRRR